MKTTIFLILILLNSSYTQITFAVNMENGSEIKKEISIGRFDKITMDIPVDMIIIPGSEYHLSLTGDEKTLALVDIKNENNNLICRVTEEEITFNRIIKDSMTYVLNGITTPFKKIKATLTTPGLIESIELARFALVEVNEPIYENHFTAYVTNIGNLTIRQLKIDTLTIYQSQIGIVQAEGEVVNLRVRNTGMKKNIFNHLKAKKVRKKIKDSEDLFKPIL